MEGLEPPRLSAPDPKSGTATNYATSAVVVKELFYSVKRTANVCLFERIPNSYA